MGNLAFNKVEYCGELKVKHENSKNMHGYYSLLSNTTGSRNAATGYYSLRANTTGSRNAATGYYSLRANTTGYNNTANGDHSLYANTTGSWNTASGYYSLLCNTTGYYNTANGYYSLLCNTTGYYNTANGYQAGRYIADGTTANETGTYNTSSVLTQKLLADGDTNETVIGNGAVGAGSNTVTLGNDDITDTYLKGDVSVSGDLITTTKTPASASATGTAGTIAYDADYIYVCTATNTWKRIAIATW